MSNEALIIALGGGSQIKAQYYAISAGRTVMVTNSKHHPKSGYYWYGISPAGVKGIDEHGVTHVAFGMGTKRIALIPVVKVKDFLMSTNTTKNADQSIRHYHVLITDKAEPVMYWSDTRLKVELKNYIVVCPEHATE